MSDQLAILLLHRRFGEKEFGIRDLSQEDVDRLLSVWGERPAASNIGRRMTVGSRLNDISRRSGSFEVKGGRRVAFSVTRKANEPIQGKPALYQLRFIS